MGVCLYYTTVEEVDDDVAATIRAQVREVCRGQPWILCEPLHFSPGKDGRLSGWSKLNLQPHPEEFAEALKVQTEDHDLRALAKALCDWSAKFGLTWRLSIEGDEIGMIANGVSDPGILEAFDSMADIANQLGRINPSELLDGRGGPSLGIFQEPEE